MQSEIRQVGNSKGIIIPKAILEQCHFERAVEMQVTEEGLMIRPAQKPHPRAGWEEAFAKAAQQDNDPLDQEWLSFPNEFDELEWKW